MMRRIAVDGVQVSQLILGSDYFSPAKYDRVAEMLDTFVALGGNTVDTARVYLGGQSEQAIGRWLRERKPSGFHVLTKGAHHDAQGPRVRPDAIRSDLERSLEALGTERVELYALHRDDPAVPVEPIVDTLNELAEAGRIGRFGASNWTVARIAAANAYAARHGLRGFSFSSPNFCLAEAREPFWPGCVAADGQMIRWHRETGLPLFSWSSQGRGFFSGRYRPEDRSDPDLVRVFYSDANWARYRRAEAFGRRHRLAPVQVALAYVLNQAFPTAAIIGPRDPSELRACAKAADWQLAPEDAAWLEHGDG